MNVSFVPRLNTHRTNRRRDSSRSKRGRSPKIEDLRRRANKEFTSKTEMKSNIYEKSVIGFKCWRFFSTWVSPVVTGLPSEFFFYHQQSRIDLSDICIIQNHNWSCFDRLNPKYSSVRLYWMFSPLLWIWKESKFPKRGSNVIVVNRIRPNESISQQSVKPFIESIGYCVLLLCVSTV